MRVTPRTVNCRSRLAADVLVVLDVELIVDLADDLLDHVLDGDQARDAAVFIDHDRHVIAVAAELLAAARSGAWTPARTPPGA